MRGRARQGTRALLRLAAALVLASSAPALADDAWIEVSTPSDGETVRAASGIVELRGRVGSGAPRAYDVVIALDGSQSTLLPTGLDLDGDGLVGTFSLPGKGDGVCGKGTHYEKMINACRRSFRIWTTDFEDIVAQAERRLAVRLLSTLEAQGSRVAFVTFGGKARVEAELGPASQARAALDALAFREDGSGSSIAAAISRGRRLLGRERDGSRLPVILLVTDGLPSVPQNERAAAAAARREAEEARDASVALYIFQIRSEEEDADTALLAEMAEMTGGRRIYVEMPERLSFVLPTPSAGAVEAVEIHNRTLDRPARAARVHPGGAFDAFVPLAAGENALEIRARLPDGSSLELRRTVYFQKSAAPSDRVRLESMLDELRKRTLQAEYAPRADDIDPDRRSLRVRTAKDGEDVDGVPIELSEPPTPEP